MMKRYMSILLILAIACAFSLSVVVAADYETHDFDGKFKMDVYTGCNFDQSIDEGVVSYTDLDKQISVLYLENSAISTNMDESELQAFKDSSRFVDDGTEGDIHMYKKGSAYGAMVIDDGIIVVVLSNVREDALDMAKSIEFTD